MGLLEACKLANELIRQYLSSSDNESAFRKSCKAQITRSMDIIEDAFCHYRLEEIAISFNGGKDCQVMLILILAVIYRRIELNDDKSILKKNALLPTVYIRSDKAFDEVDEFVRQCDKRYSLNTVTLAYPMKSAFESYLKHHDSVKAIFVGIRRTDPYGGTLRYQQETDHGWPKFIRFHPVLEWHYVEIWDFLRFTKEPYCALYDKGYTSLGGSDNTHKNPHLESGIDENGQTVYQPAYLLKNDDEERLGRI